MKNLIDLLLPMALGQLDNISTEDKLQAVYAINNLSASILDGNRDEFNLILYTAKVPDKLISVLIKVYDELNSEPINNQTR